jgi:hypothetical protein
MLKQASRTDYNYKEFYCDTAEDVAKIDVAAACPGSVAYVIATQDVYILNNNKQ